MTTTSGWQAAITSIACRAVFASPTTSNSLSLAKSARKPSRTSS